VIEGEAPQHVWWKEYTVWKDRAGGESYTMKNKGVSGRRQEDSLLNLTQTIGSFEVKCRQVVTSCLALAQLGISRLKTGGHKNRGMVGGSSAHTLNKTMIFYAKYDWIQKR